MVGHDLVNVASADMVGAWTGQLFIQTGLMTWTPSLPCMCHILLWAQSLAAVMLRTSISTHAIGVADIPDEPAGGWSSSKEALTPTVCVPLLLLSMTAGMFMTRRRALLGLFLHAHVRQ